jgi:hypothetical protein
MIALRIGLIVLVVVLGALIGAWIVSSDRRFLRFAWVLLKVALVALGIFLALLLVEGLLRAV